MSSWLSLPELLNTDIAERPDPGGSSATWERWGRAADTRPASTLDSWQGFGAATAIVGALTSAAGSFFSAQSSKSELKSQALSQEFEASQSARAARAAEQEAQSIKESARYDVAAVTAKAGADKASLRAQRGGSGVLIGVGSASEAQVSIDLVKEIDVLNIRTNAARAAGAARTQAQAASTNSKLASVSAQNLRGTARSISPFSGAASSLLTSATRIGSQWVTDRRRKD